MSGKPAFRRGFTKFAGWERPIIVALEPDKSSPPIVREDPALGSLDARIDAARKAEDERMAQAHAPMRGTEPSGWFVASTMVGYPLGGIVVGFTLDQVLDTTPWITIGLMFTAFAGACLQIVRTLKTRAD